ncbi:hypothetical protein [Candidatus Methylomirabilis sp.]|uniref:hypothetical protein n=1 Tax=Candidatus Methylomirabilis sp. TaxID=2032687 RepID=UPI002A65159C|nr:hypothetical protein [Candidatus Methylomirabilis sp.]
MKYKRLGDDRGLILPLVLMAFVVLAALAAAILSIGGSEAQIASNLLRAIQARFLAEAGLEHAFNTLRTTPSDMTNANATLQNIIPATQLGGAGSYTVQYQKAGDYTVRVVSTGASAIGGSQAIRRAVMSTFFRSNDAILTDGSMTIGGSTDVLATGGTCGNVHANGNLTLNGGHVEINGNATASGTYSNPAGATVGAGSGGGTPTETVPHIDPADFLTAATNLLAGHLDHLYQMTVNANGKGEVRDGSGTLLQTLNSRDTSTCGWKYTADTPLASWDLASNTPCDGTFYFDGSVTVTGSTTDPWKTTLIATGDVKITGNPTIGADAAYTVHDSLFIAGRDVKIQGTPSNGYNGLIAAHEQFDLSGTGTITGLIIGENAPDTPGSPVSANIVNGNITLTYNCGSNPPLQGPLQFLSWGL